MIALYLVAGVLGQQSASTSGTSAAGSKGRRRRNKIAHDFVNAMITQIVAEELPIEAGAEPQKVPKPGRKKRRAIAKKIIVAAGAGDILPFVPMFKDEIERIGNIAVQAASLPNPAEAQARYDAILRIIDEMQRQKAEQDELDELDIEELLLAA